MTVTKIRYILNKTNYLEKFRSRDPNNAMRREDIEIAIINKDRVAKVGAKIKKKLNISTIFTIIC
jgi:hypothetical protein